MHVYHIVMECELQTDDDRHDEIAGQLLTPQPSAQGHICQNFTKLLHSNWTTLLRSFYLHLKLITELKIHHLY